MNKEASTIRLSDDVSGKMRLIVEGELRTESIANVWAQARKHIQECKKDHIVIDASNVNYCDGTGIAMLADLLLESRRITRLNIELEGLKPPFSAC